MREDERMKVDISCGERLCQAFADCLAGKVSKPKGDLRVGVDLGTANIVTAVLDSEDNPVAGKIQKAQVVKDGLVVDFVGARTIVSKMVEELEENLGRPLKYAACAVPPGTTFADCKSTKYVVESSGLEVLDVLGEPQAAAKVLGIADGAVVDIGGGTTGISVIKDAKEIYTADEPTGGTHFTLVIAGHYNISFEEAEDIKLDETNQAKLFPILHPVMEKVASIIERHVSQFDIDIIYLVGGASSLKGLKDVVEKRVGIRTYIPNHPLYVTPLGIALLCPKGSD
jgi:ethanolamine utilization protein EutJ